MKQKGLNCFAEVGLSLASLHDSNIGVCYNHHVHITVVIVESIS